MNKNLFLVAGLIVAVAVAVGFWGWEKRNDKAIQYRQPTLERMTTEEIGSQENLTFDELFQDALAMKTIIPDTSSWHEYENKNIGFKTKLPKDWIGQAENISGCLGTVDNKYGIEIEGIGYDCPIQIDRYLQSEKEVIEIIKSIRIEQKFSKIEIGQGKNFLYFIDKGDRVNIYFKNGNSYWYALINGNEITIEELLKIFNGIISEFANTK